MTSEATIRRGARNARYAAIPNHVFEDSRLSMEARWLLSYLLSKPDDWTVVIGDIIKKGNCGRDKARNMIAELVKLGYAERDQQRADGKFGSSVLVIFDEPRAVEGAVNQGVGNSVASLPQTDLPATVMPSPVSPSPGKSAHSNNSDSVNTDSYQGRESARDFSSNDLKDLEKRFDVLRIGKRNNPWPGVLGSSKEWAFRQFLKLTPEQKLLAEDRRDAYLAVCPKVKSGEHRGEPNPVALGVYLRDKMFNDVAAIAPIVVQRTASELIPMKPFGPIWAGKRMMALLGGPLPVEMPDDVYGAARDRYELYRRSSESRATAFLDRKGIALKDGQLVFPEDFHETELAARSMEAGFPEVNRLHKLAGDHATEKVDASLQFFGGLCEFVPAGTDVFQEWQAYHAERCWPFVPDLGSHPGVYFPKGGPSGISEFEIAATAALGTERGDVDAA